MRVYGFVHENRFLLLLVSAASDIGADFVVQSKMKTRKAREKFFERRKAGNKEEAVHGQQTDVTDVQQTEATEKKEELQQENASKK